MRLKEAIIKIIKENYDKGGVIEILQEIKGIPQIKEQLEDAINFLKISGDFEHITPLHSALSHLKDAENKIEEVLQKLEQ